MQTKPAGIRKQSSPAYNTAALCLYFLFCTTVGHEDFEIIVKSTSSVDYKLMKRDRAKWCILSMLLRSLSSTLKEIENPIIAEITAGETTLWLCACHSLVPNTLYATEIIIFITQFLIMHTFKKRNCCLRQKWLLIGWIQM